MGVPESANIGALLLALDLALSACCGCPDQEEKLKPCIENLTVSKVLVQKLRSASEESKTQNAAVDAVVPRSPDSASPSRVEMEPEQPKPLDDADCEEAFDYEQLLPEDAVVEEIVNGFFESDGANLSYELERAKTNKYFHQFEKETKDDLGEEADDWTFGDENGDPASDFNDWCLFFRRMINLDVMCSSKEAHAVVKGSWQASTKQATHDSATLQASAKQHLTAAAAAPAPAPTAEAPAVTPAPTVEAAKTVAPSPAATHTPEAAAPTCEPPAPLPPVEVPPLDYEMLMSKSVVVEDIVQKFFKDGGDIDHECNKAKHNLHFNKFECEMKKTAEDFWRFGHEGSGEDGDEGDPLADLSDWCHYFRRAVLAEAASSKCSVQQVIAASWTAQQEPAAPAKAEAFAAASTTAAAELKEVREFPSEAEKKALEMKLRAQLMPKEVQSSKLSAPNARLSQGKAAVDTSIAEVHQSDAATFMALSSTSSMGDTPLLDRAAEIAKFQSQTAAISNLPEDCERSEGEKALLEIRDSMLRSKLCEAGVDVKESDASDLPFFTPASVPLPLLAKASSQIPDPAQTKNKPEAAAVEKPNHAAAAKPKPVATPTRRHRQKATVLPPEPEGNDKKQQEESNTHTNTQKKQKNEQTDQTSKKQKTDKEKKKKESNAKK